MTSTFGPLRLVAAGALVAVAGLGMAQPQAPAGATPEFPPFEEVSKGFEKVAAAADAPSLYTLWRNGKDHQLLAELPKDFEGKRFFITPTVASGDPELGVFTAYTRWGGPGDRYVAWKRVRNRLMLVEPSLSVRTSGDADSKRSAERAFTESVLLDVPILTMGPEGGPVIDLDHLLLADTSKFFGPYFARGARLDLATIAKIKAFPTNIEAAFTLPVREGQMVTLHYSISSPTPSPGFKTREADRRVGFFYTNFTDLAKHDGLSQTVRYAHRWNLEKADPKLKMSPPKRPIVFYIEHTTPVRYRRWVQAAILEWNKAFEKVGIVDAVVVYQQDADTGAHMDKDPEDARYNFVRWTNSNIGYAIGPSRVIPETGEIIDADIVMDESFLSLWAADRASLLREAAMEGYDAETLAWLEANPGWDPRVRLAPPGEREAILARRAAGAEAAPGAAEDGARGSLLFRMSSNAGPCALSRGLSPNVALGRVALDAEMLAAAAGEEGEAEPDVLDGLPEWFVGPLLKWVVSHEVGHTLGLMHNFKASSIYTQAQINSAEWKGHKPFGGSVMDYYPINVAPGGKEDQGDVAMIGIGPYDYWAIEWGYTAGDEKPIARRAAEPELAFLGDEGSYGPDPRTRVWDLGADGLEWAQQQTAVAQDLRGKLIDKILKEGQSWQRLRDHYTLLLYNQHAALNAAAGYIGGASVARDRKGDPDARDPLTVIPVAKQREALKFVLENGLRESSFGLTPALLAKMGADEWWDEWGGDGADWPVHDTVLGLQASILTRLMNPTTLRRVLDNEQRTPAGEDALTMPELLEAVRKEVWSELSSMPTRAATARDPMISSFRRNLQREHLDRLVQLATTPGWGGASSRPLTTLARQELRDIQTMVEKAPADRLDPYTRSHLSDAKERIEDALDAAFIRGG